MPEDTNKQIENKRVAMVRITHLLRFSIKLSTFYCTRSTGAPQALWKLVFKNRPDHFLGISRVFYFDVIHHGFYDCVVVAARINRVADKKHVADGNVQFFFNLAEAIRLVYPLTGNVNGCKPAYM